MKKIAFTFILLFVLSISAFAEGETHNGGRSCPQGQTCSEQEPTNTQVSRQEKPGITVFTFQEFRNFFGFLKSFI